jgi:uncharacterized membrane protein
MPPSGPLPSASLATVQAWIASMTVTGSGGGTSVTPPPVVLVPTFKSISENILQPKCVTCHRPGGREPGIRYDSYSATISRGRVVAGKASESEMYQEIAKGSMPPAKDGYPPLTIVEVDVIRQWINAGALNN